MLAAGGGILFDIDYLVAVAVLVDLARLERAIEFKRVVERGFAREGQEALEHEQSEHPFHLVASMR